MIRVIFADMRSSARVWLGATIVVAVAAFASIIPAVLIDAGARALSSGGAFVLGGSLDDVDPASLAGLALISIASTIIVLTSIATIVVLGSIMRLTVSLRRRSYALWQTIGISPAQVRLIVLAQLLVVSLIGSVIGALVGSVIVPALATAALQGSNGVDTFSLAGSPISAAPVVAFVVVVAMLGGAPAARRASRTRPLEVLRESPAIRRARRWPRWVAAAIIVALVAQLLATLPASVANGTGSQSILIGPLLVAATALLGPVIFAPVMRWWTAIVPPTASATWFIARANTLFAADRSSSIVASLLIAVALPGSFAAGQATSGAAAAIIRDAAAAENPAGSLALILGGPVLLAAAGAAAATVMSSGARAREAALLTAAGAAPGFSIRTALGEGVIQVGTAAVLALALVAVTAGSQALVLAPIAPGVLPDFAWPIVFGTLGITTLGILLATLVPTLATRNQVVPSALSSE